jgi:hypothetical protein
VSVPFNFAVGMKSLGVIRTANYAVYTRRGVGLTTVQVYDAAWDETPCHWGLVPSVLKDLNAFVFTVKHSPSITASRPSILEQSHLSC